MPFCQNLKVIVSVLFLFLASVGCNREAKPKSSAKFTPPATSSLPESPQGNASEFIVSTLDPARLRFPQNWKSFEGSLKSYRNTAESEVESIMQEARQLAKSDRRPHPRDLGKISVAMINCAAVKAKAGKSAEALQILKEAQEYGGMNVEMLALEAFNSIRESDEFKAFVAFGEQESQEGFFGRNLVRQPPLFKLSQLLETPTTPELPKLSGEVVVVFTGNSHMMDAAVFQECLACQVPTIAVTNEDLKVPDGVQVFKTNSPEASLVIDRTPIFWFANPNGEVVAYLRPHSGQGMATAIINTLKK